MSTGIKKYHRKLAEQSCTMDAIQRLLDASSDYSPHRAAWAIHSQLGVTIFSTDDYTLFVKVFKWFALYLFQFSNISNITSDLKNMGFVWIRTYIGLKYKLYMAIHNNSMSVSKWT